jgi:phosphofructokinase-like protein
MSKKLKIAINTGGGDAPGLNAVIQAVTLSALNKGWEAYGIRTGYAGLLDTQKIIPLTRERVWHIATRGGTILGTTNKGNPFKLPVPQEDGSILYHDVSGQIVENFHKMGFDCLVAVGGDGSLDLAYKLYQKGIPVIGVPKTIDNDLRATVVSFGFDTAVSVATDALDRLHSTAQSHDRVMVVEVMGRHAGWIALNSGISGEADVILIPEIPFEIDKICQHIHKLAEQGQNYAIVVVAEGARPQSGVQIHKGSGELGRQDVLLGGIAEYLAKEIAARTQKDTRSIVLGHLQRGGSPTTFDRLISLRFGAAAVRQIEAGNFGTMVALDPPQVYAIPLKEVIGDIKRVPTDCDSIITGRSIGICFGD